MERTTQISEGGGTGSSMPKESLIQSQCAQRGSAVILMPRLLESVIYEENLEDAEDLLRD